MPATSNRVRRRRLSQRRTKAAHEGGGKLSVGRSGRVGKRGRSRRRVGGMQETQVRTVKHTQSGVHEGLLLDTFRETVCNLVTHKIQHKLLPKAIVLRSGNEVKSCLPYIDFNIVGMNPNGTFRDAWENTPSRFVEPTLKQATLPQKPDDGTPSIGNYEDVRTKLQDHYSQNTLSKLTNETDKKYIFDHCHSALQRMTGRHTESIEDWQILYISSDDTGLAAIKKWHIDPYKCGFNNIYGFYIGDKQSHSSQIVNVPLYRPTNWDEMTSCEQTFAHANACSVSIEALSKPEMQPYLTPFIEQRKRHLKGRTERAKPQFNTITFSMIGYKSTQCVPDLSKETNRYYPGKITQERRDGTFDIDYDDGMKETGVSRDLIRVRDRGRGRDDDDSRRSRRSGSSDRLKEGALVEARYVLSVVRTFVHKQILQNREHPSSIDFTYDSGVTTCRLTYSTICVSRTDVLTLNNRVDSLSVTLSQALASLTEGSISRVALWNFRGSAIATKGRGGSEGAGGWNLITDYPANTLVDFPQSAIHYGVYSGKRHLFVLVYKPKDSFRFELQPALDYYFRQLTKTDTTTFPVKVYNWLCDQKFDFKTTSSDSIKDSTPPTDGITNFVNSDAYKTKLQNLCERYDQMVILATKLRNHIHTRLEGSYQTFVNPGFIEQNVQQYIQWLFGKIVPIPQSIDDYPYFRYVPPPNNGAGFVTRLRDQLERLMTSCSNADSTFDEGQLAGLRTFFTQFTQYQFPLHTYLINGVASVANMPLKGGIKITVDPELKTLAEHILKQLNEKMSDGNLYQYLDNTTAQEAYKGLLNPTANHDIRQFITIEHKLRSGPVQSKFDPQTRELEDDSIGNFDGERVCTSIQPALLQSILALFS